MSTSANVRRTRTLTYGDDLSEPVGAKFMTRSTVQANKPGVIVTDECLAISSIEHTFEFKFQGYITPPTPGDITDAKAVYETFINSVGGSGGSDITETLPDCMSTDSDSDQSGESIGVQTVAGRYTGTELQPRTLA